MRRRNFGMLIASAAFMGIAALSAEQVSAHEYEGWELVWSDEFDKAGVPDSASWNFEHGFVRNNELQWYQDANARCEDGLLVIEGRKEKFKNPNYKPESRSWRENREYVDYTSSSINTRGKHEFQYGRYEVRARLPLASGSWPAIWTLGTSQGWPSCGEIDIMEYYRIDGQPHILANAAWGSEGRRHDAKWNSRKVPFTHFSEKDPEWGNKFHVWRMDWDEDYIRLYLDDELLNEIPLAETVNGELGGFINPFKQPHYILLNLAMGSNGGEIDESALPMKYEVDYVRVYQKKK